MATSNQAFSAFSFISFIMALIPFAWHLESWNTGTCIFMGWVSIGSFIFFVNSVVWNDNVINRAPVYCDIATKIIVGLYVGIPASLMCINRRLYHIVSMKAVGRSNNEKRTGVLVDLVIGIGIPVIIMILHVIVQNHRFDIFEDIGCLPSIFNTALAYVLILGPTLILALIAITSFIMNFIIFKRNRVDFERFVPYPKANRCKRLMHMTAVVSTLIIVPYNVYTIVINSREGVRAWVSWKDTHSGFTTINMLSQKQLSADPALLTKLQILRWSTVITSFLFCCFGYGEEAISQYQRVYNFVVTRRFGCRKVSIPLQFEKGFNSRMGGQGWGNSGHWADTTAPKRGWVNSTLNAFRNKIGSVRLPWGRTSTSTTGSIYSEGSIIFNSGSRSSRRNLSRAKKGGLPVLVTKEIIRRHDFQTQDTDSTISGLTRITTDFSSYSDSRISGDSVPYYLQKPSSSSSPSEVAVDGEAPPEAPAEVHWHDIPETPSEYSEFSPIALRFSTTNVMNTVDMDTQVPTDNSSSLVVSKPLPLPPPALLSTRNYEDYLTTPTLMVTSPGLRQAHMRTPPKQTIPSSPTWTGSFLDLRASMVSERSSFRGGPLADDRV